jgi:hypothetical protein
LKYGSIAAIRENEIMRKQLTLAGALSGLLMIAPHMRFANAAPEQPPSHALVGVWQVVEQGGRPTAGVYIFTATHYSMIAAAPERPDISDTNKATADELRAVWGPMLANAGVYEIAGDLITIRPIVAKIPVVMKPGAYEVYAFQVQGDMLSLTQRRNVRGPVERAATTKLKRVE